MQHQRAESQVKGLPAGWSIMKYTHHPDPHRDAVILCERMVDDGDHGTEFVVWWHNQIEGGCYLGLYTDDRSKAELEFSRRGGLLR